MTPKSKTSLKRAESDNNLDFNFKGRNRFTEKKRNTSGCYKEPATSDSTPHKSMVESDEVYDSFCMPGVDDFQLEFRNKVLANNKTDHNSMRHKFLNKLAQQKVWLLPNAKPKSHQTCIIFDWDDTLLCTTFLNPDGYVVSGPVPNSFLPFLLKLEKVVVEILTESLKHGKVLIITNAAEGWVEYSSRKYMPKVHKLLHKVTVISARSKYEHKYPGNSLEWKMNAFQETMKDMEISAVTNLVALGDNDIEIQASKNLANNFSRALLKTVKFRVNPSPEELIKQLTLVGNKMESICTNVKNLTIRLERRKKEVEDLSPNTSAPTPLDP